MLVVLHVPSRWARIQCAKIACFALARGGAGPTHMTNCRCGTHPDDVNEEIFEMGKAPRKKSSRLQLVRALLKMAAFCAFHPPSCSYPINCITQDSFKHVIKNDQNMTERSFRVNLDPELYCLVKFNLLVLQSSRPRGVEVEDLLSAAGKPPWYLTWVIQKVIYLTVNLTLVPRST
eukprot:SAG11_NODE_4950_length_1711_cov_46.867866_1_plen_176_part_00